MRRAPGIAMVLPRIRATLERDETISTLAVRHAAARAGEVGIERRRVLVILVKVAAGRVRLPNFHDRLPERPPIAVEHPAGDDDPFADWFAGVLARQVMIQLGDGPRKHGRREIMEPLG